MVHLSGEILHLEVHREIHLGKISHEKGITEHDTSAKFSQEEKHLAP